MPNSTSTISGAPEAISTGARDHDVIAMILPSWGRWGTGPASPINSVRPAAARPVGTTFASARSSCTCPFRPTPQDPVVMTVGDREAAPERLHRVLDPGCEDELGVRWVRHCPGADVGDRRGAAAPPDAIDAGDDVELAERGPHDRLLRRASAQRCARSEEHTSELQSPDH